MKHYLIVVAGLAALSACSGSREREGHPPAKVAEGADLTLPDSISRTDTSVTLSSRSEQPVSAVEQQVPRSEPQRAKARPAKTRRHPRLPASKPATSAPIPATPPADTAVRAYAPGTSADTATPPDSIGATDSIPAVAWADTTPASRIDTVAARAKDTVIHQRSDTAGRTDTAASRSADTSSTARDTVLTGPGDTSVATAAPAAPSPSPSTTVAARTLPIGTEIHAALNDSITSRRDTVGQPVSGYVMENVIGPDGRTLIAAGTPVRFTITRLRASRSKNSQGRLAIRVDSIAVNGRLQPVQADIHPVPRELRGRGVTAGDAAKVGGGAAAGAVLGRVVGGNTRGAVIGGVAGAAAGAVVATQTATRDVVVKAKTPVTFVLTAPLAAP